MRNIFDQYEQPENRLTHALATTLDRERSLLVPFLRWLGIRDAPKPRGLMLLEQQVPGRLQEMAEELDAKGLPDIAIFDNDGWAVLLESKVQACVNLKQLERHRRTVQRLGFESPWLVLISVDRVSCELFEKTVAKTWQDVYAWFNRHSDSSDWARHFVQYMQVFERKMILQEYPIRGTITVFDGLRFDADNPYTYREGKRLIGLLGDLLQQRKDLHAIGIDPKGKRRPAITGKGTDGVWDFLPLEVAREAQFTSFPHFTMGINRAKAVAAITVPNGVKGGFRTKLKAIGMENFFDLVRDVEKRLQPVIKRSKGSKPMMYATQRHFRSQKSVEETDARLEADLRTAVRQGKHKTKYQPEWIEAIYNVLVNRRSNIQFGMDVNFRYMCPIVRSPQAADLFADTWKALSPLVDFAMHSERSAE